MVLFCLAHSHLHQHFIFSSVAKRQSKKSKHTPNLHLKIDAVFHILKTFLPDLIKSCYGNFSVLPTKSSVLQKFMAHTEAGKRAQTTAAHPYSPYEWVVLKIQNHGSLRILQQKCLVASSTRSINSIWNSWNVAPELEQELAIAIISFNFIVYIYFPSVSLFLWISFSQAHVQQKINWISRGGLDLFGFHTAVFCAR